MKKAVLLVAALLVTGVTILVAVNHKLNPVAGYTMEKDYEKDYEKLWQKVDSLENKGLPKSALEVVNLIYDKAVEENNSDQLIKAYIHQVKFEDAFEENAFVNAINRLKKDCQEASFPNNRIMHSMLAEMYWTYYQANQWKFNQRSETAGHDNDDITTWDLNKLLHQVIVHYKLSLEDAERLQKTKISIYKEIIDEGSKDEGLRPTLYDFLAHRAIDFFKDTRASVTQPADKFELQNDKYFELAPDFFNLNITSTDTLSVHYHATRVFKELLKIRYADKSNVNAYLDAELKRLKFVYQNSVNPLKDTLYIESLQAIVDQYPKSPLSAMARYQMADHYFNSSLDFQANNPLKKHKKWYKKTAMEICREAVDKHPLSEGAGECKELMDRILEPSLNFTAENVHIPGQPFPVRIDYKNFDTVYLKVAAIDRYKIDKLADDYYGKDFYDKAHDEAREVYQKSMVLPLDGDFNPHAVEEVIKPLPLGTYMMIISGSPDFTYKQNMVAYGFTRVSNLSYYTRQVKGTHQFHVMHRESGLPIQGVKAQPYYQKYNSMLRKYVQVKGSPVYTDKNGYFELSPGKDGERRTYSVDLSHGDDFLSTKKSFYVYNYNESTYSTYYTTIFTDRAIYRPGQTVYFKGITIRKEGDENQVVSKANTNVVLYDVNRQKVDELAVTTNEYGTFSGTFVLPTGLLNGNFEIHTSHGSKQISVEEYKRPKFEVKILPFDGNYRLNDEVKVKGKAVSYAGANLTGSKVTYRVERKPRWLGWWYFHFDDKGMEITNGTLQTDDKGEFDIRFQAIPDLSLGKNDHISFDYTVHVDVTDLNGETQSTSKSLSVGYKALKISLDMNDKLDKSAKEIKESGQEVTIHTRNLNGEFVPASGSITFYSLQGPGEILRDRKWDQPDEYLYTEKEWQERLPGMVYKDELDFKGMNKGKSLLKVNFNTKLDKQFTIKNIDKWASGRYVAEVESKDAFGQPVKHQQYFTLYSAKENKPPFPSIDWFEAIKTRGEPGEDAVFLVGSGEGNVRVLQEVEHKGKIIKSQVLELGNSQQLVKIPIKEAYRGNFSVYFTFIKNNRFYHHSQLVTVPYTNKQLDIEFGTFRNKLYPGQDEEWRVTIKGQNGDKVAAEMVATLYDASLDQFRKNYWNFDIYKHYYSTMAWGTNAFSTSSGSYLSEDFHDYYYHYLGSYSQFNWFDLLSRLQYNNYAGGMLYESVGYASRSPRTMYKSSAKKEMMADDAVMMEFDEEEEVEVELTPGLVQDEKSGKPDGEPPVKARTNFNETAFFFPKLATNEKGDVIIKFTIPEALTRWRMMGFAHTRDLEYGFVENELVTQKELMVMPNPPRFFRQGDKIEFPVKISNISGKNLEGTASLELFDAITMKPVNNIFLENQTKKAFAVDASQNTSVSWQLQVPDDVQMLTYRVVARANGFSDGEEKPVPVLTNRMLVTESLPLPIRGNETKTLTFDKLLNSGKSSSIKHQKLTLEFTSNPAWYAIQALPYLMEYPYECSEQVFSRYYANSIAFHVANSNPKIKRVFDAWKNTPGSKALLSNLEKNQELKSVLLEETPWVLDTKDESTRKRNVGLLFDLNRMANEMNSAMKKLQEAQLSNGGFPWFKGMPDNQYITQHVVTGLGHLDVLGVKPVRDDDKVWRMTEKAIAYLDKELEEDYEWLIKHVKEEDLPKDHLSYIAIHYLYGRSYFKDIPLPRSTREAFDYFKGQAEKYWLDRNQYMQGMIALALHRYESTKVAGDIMKSLKEHATSNEEMGMYWKSYNKGYYWYQSPIEMQALMIEAFDEVAGDDEAVEELKIWLLKQKQTQDWKTTKATVEACYALLRRGTELLASDAQVEIKLGGALIDPYSLDDVQVEAGTGYFKTSWGRGEIKPEMGKVELTKNDQGVAWGALYWQYFEDLDKITSHETPLKLKKQLFVERNTGRGPVIEPLAAKDKLQVGDKVIVRIELRVDRVMEFVHMKDTRASGFEPMNVISRYKWQDGFGYYESTKDASTNFFMDRLPKGTHVFEYPLRVSHAGDFSNGITSIQCMYAPEFTSHSEGIRVKVE